MKDILQIKKSIKQFILNASYLSDDQVNYETQIFTQGILDSMGLMLLIDFIEETFSFKALDGDILETNFESINTIAAFVTNKLNHN